MAKHEKTFVDFDQPYEQNIIGLRGIIYFGIGLFLLIVVTFGLMWVLQFQVFQASWDEEDKKNQNPMALTADEKLPPEPRLQSAPGFGVDNPKGGRVSLELREPQAEYRELEKQWNELWEKGQKDEKTGTVIALPIAEAKKKLLESGEMKGNDSEAGKKALEDATLMVSDSSSGRNASVRRR